MMSARTMNRRPPYGRAIPRADAQQTPAACAGRTARATRATIGAAICGVAVLIAGVAAAAPSGPLAIELQNGIVLRGVVRQIQPSLYLIQSDARLYEVSAGEIATVDGDDDVMKKLPKADRKLFRYETYEELQNDASVVSWDHFDVTNESGKVTTYLEWGAQQRELADAKASTTFDQFGQPLEQRIEPRPGSDIYDVYHDLRVPIVPGERIRFTTRYRYENRVAQENGHAVYRFGGDFPDDRIVTRKIALPAGAVLVRAEPEPLMTFEYEGRTIVVWRRYYPAGEVHQQTIVYDPAR
jgi:hypothetical protein